jgi:hypothetical protein
MENEAINQERVVWSVILVSMVCSGTRARGEMAEASGGIKERHKSPEQRWCV